MSRSPVSVVVLAVVVAATANGVVGAVAADDVTLEITVVDRNGNEVSGVSLSVTWNDGEGGPRTATTRANGKALVDVPEGANVAIRTDDDSYARNRPYTVNNVEGGAVTVPVSEGGRAAIVVEGADGRIADARVEVRDAAGRVDQQTTNGSGVARTDVLEIGEYTVRVTAPRHRQSEATVEITNVEVTETVRVERADVTATVTVVDDHFDDPRPVGNATVRLAADGTTATTDSDGTATIPVPVNSRPELVVSKAGYETGRTTPSVGQEPPSVDVAIRRSPAVNVAAVNRQVVVGESTVVTVTDQYDRPLEGAPVSVGGETAGRTDADGRLRVTIESAGDVTVEASSGGQTGTATVEGVDPSGEGTPTPTATGPTPRPGNGTETPGAGGPGFGVVGGLCALGTAGLLARRA
jgi:hypothetical protein